MSLEGNPLEPEVPRAIAQALARIRKASAAAWPPELSELPGLPEEVPFDAAMAQAAGCGATQLLGLLVVSVLRSDSVGLYSTSLARLTRATRSRCHVLVGSRNVAAHARGSGLSILPLSAATEHSRMTAAAYTRIVCEVGERAAELHTVHEFPRRVYLSHSGPTSNRDSADEAIVEGAPAQ